MQFRSLGEQTTPTSLVVLPIVNFVAVFGTSVRAVPMPRRDRPPGRPFIVRTEEPTASTTPMNSWPIRFPVSLGVIES